MNVSKQKNRLYSQVKSLSKMAENSAVKKGYFVITPTKSKQSYASAGGILFVLVFVLGFIFARFTFDIFSGLSPFIFIGLGLLITAVVFMIFAKIMPKKTVQGVHAKEYLKGLEDYMKLAESDRIKTLQSPSGAEKLSINTSDKQQLVKLYEKLLPYAVLFGIEKDWAEQIAPLYTQQPNWYSGSQAFNSAVFVSAVSNLNSATTSSFSAPSSSGSSGGAGGGGGGGGGGGW